MLRAYNRQIVPRDARAPPIPRHPCPQPRIPHLAMRAALTPRCPFVAGADRSIPGGNGAHRAFPYDPALIHAWPIVHWCALWAAPGTVALRPALRWAVPVD